MVSYVLAAPVKFEGRAAEFVAELKERVDAYFDERGLSRHADWRVIARTPSAFSLTFIPYALILTNRFDPWTMLILAIVMGVGVAGIGFGVSHDALHGAYSANPAVNRLLGYSFDLLGANGYLWKITHNVIHHTYTNIQGVDEDLEVSPLIRLSPRSEWRPIHRIQPVFAFVLHGLSALFWGFAKDYKYFLHKNLGPFQNKKHPPAEIAILMVGKLVYYGWAVGIPFPGV